MITRVSIQAVAGQTAGFWVLAAGAGEEPLAGLDVRTHTGLTGLPGDWVAIVTLHTPGSSTQAQITTQTCLDRPPVTY